MRKFLVGLFSLLLVFAYVPFSKGQENPQKIIYETLNGYRATSTALTDEEVDFRTKEKRLIKIEFNYNYPDELLPQINLNATESEVNAIMELHNSAIKAFFIERNTSSIKSYNLPANAYISHYTPFVVFEVDSLNPYLELLEKISRDINVRNVYVTEVEKVKDCDINTKASSSYIQLADAYKNILMSDGLGGYDGSGVRVGVLEVDGTVEYEDRPNFLPNSIIRRNEPNPALGHYNSVHATEVASVINGNEGIARKSTIYSAQYLGVGMMEEIEWMADNNVSVVNMSFSSSIPDGKLNSDSKYVDFIIRNKQMSVVASAGNLHPIDNPNRLISSVGAARYAITVGSVNKDISLSNISCYNSEFSVSKPEVLAVGENLFVPNQGILNGTSFSAPMVTAGVACLMQRVPALKTKPQLVKAILCASASPIVRDENAYYSALETSGFHPKMGAGIVNLTTANSLATNSAYARAVDISSATSGSVVFEQSLWINGFAVLAANVSWTSDSSDAFSGSASYSNYDLRVIDPNGDVVSVGKMKGMANSTYNTSEQIYTYLMGSGNFKLQVILSGNKTPKTDCLAIAYSL